MTGSSLKLRIRSKKGIEILKCLNSSNSLNDLKKAIADMTGIDYCMIKILKGYPPTVIDSSNENKSLSSLALKDGELLTVEESSSPSSSSSSSSSEKPTITKSSSPPLKPMSHQTTTSDDKKQTSDQLPSSKSKTSNTTQKSTSNKPTSENEFNGILLRKVVPANNSCLFTSVNFVMENGILNLDCQKSMRELIAKTVKNDPITFNEAILGKKNSEYCDWIRNSSSWGGSIEIMILSKYYKCEICVVDIRTGRIDRFGEDCSYPTRVFIIYDGIHFDPLYLQSVSSYDTTKTKFSTEDNAVMIQALEMANEAKKARQFTDVANFKLKCLCCQQPLAGQKAAQEHAEKTGHINFGEI